MGAAACLDLPPASAKSHLSYGGSASSAGLRAPAGLPCLAACLHFVLLTLPAPSILFASQTPLPLWPTALPFPHHAGSPQPCQLRVRGGPPPSGGGPQQLHLPAKQPVHRGAGLQGGCHLQEGRLPAGPLLCGATDAAGGHSRGDMCWVHVGGGRALCRWGVGIGYVGRCGGTNIVWF